MQIEGTPCLKAKVGVQQQLSLDKYFGKASANLTYKSAEMSQADMDKLGITAAQRSHTENCRSNAPNRASPRSRSRPWPEVPRQTER